VWRVTGGEKLRAGWPRQTRKQSFATRQVMYKYCSTYSYTPTNFAPPFASAFRSVIQEINPQSPLPLPRQPPVYVRLQLVPPRLVAKLGLFDGLDPDLGLIAHIVWTASVNIHPGDRSPEWAVDGQSPLVLVSRSHLSGAAFRLSSHLNRRVDEHGPSGWRWSAGSTLCRLRATSVGANDESVGPPHEHLRQGGNSKEDERVDVCGESSREVECWEG
jgi:hypothetical protein